METTAQTPPGARRARPILLLRLGAILIVLAFLGYGFGYYALASKEADLARQALAAGRYIEAEMRAEFVRGLWPVEVLGFKRDALKSAGKEAGELRQDEEEYRAALQARSAGDLEAAKDELLGISDASPRFEAARRLLNEVEDAIIEARISGALESVRSEARAAREAADAARQEVETERLERLRAEERAEEREEELEKLRLEGTEINKVAKSWTPFVVSINCEFEDLGKGTLGSGTLVNTNDSGLAVLTNRHVITEEDSMPSSCEIDFAEDVDDIVDVDNPTVKTFGDFDLALIPLTSASKETANYITANIRQFNPGDHMCEDGAIASGDEVIILGYPKIGSRDDITVTRGIISGKDDEYFVTDAKIDQGNSGGAAVLAAQNCFLGIPTAAAVGRIESLGRILDLRPLLK